MSEHNIVRCTFERHAGAILAIFNEAIVNSTALYDYKARTPQNMVAWFDAKQSGGFPVIGVEDSRGKLMGFGSYGTFRAWPAYKYTVEHSVYVEQDHRGQGLGRVLMQELIAAARHANPGTCPWARATNVVVATAARTLRSSSTRETSSKETRRM